MSQDLSPLVCRIAFSRAKYIGPHGARLILELIPNVEELVHDPDVLRRHFPRTRKRIVDELRNPNLISEAKRIAEWCDQEQVRVYFVGDDDYPYRLAQCPDAPPVLYAKGAFEHWRNDMSISVVGTRNITHYGQTMTDRLITDLSQTDTRPLIVSGLAYGVDILAHRKALALGLPTVAVLAHGFDRMYPAVHRGTALEILKHGAWVSEYPAGTTPDRHNFVARNRIIAGLSDATLVIEAGAKSGSLITANLAAEYNREVLAVPGRLIDQYSEGCNQLIAQLKGILVTSGEDIARALGLDLRCNTLQQRLDLDFIPDIDNPTLRLISQHQPIQINEIIQRSGMSMQEVSTHLFELELDGYITNLPGGLYILAK